MRIKSYASLLNKCNQSPEGIPSMFLGALHAKHRLRPVHWAEFRAFLGRQTRETQIALTCRHAGGVGVDQSLTESRETLIWTCSRLTYGPERVGVALVQAGVAEGVRAGRGVVALGAPGLARAAGRHRRGAI